MDVEKIRDSIKEPREKLLNHKLYTEIKSIEDLQIFTSNHIFAVWDFMSLLKALQNNLTCTKVPWTPNKNSETAYLINEIVLAEETDISQDGKRKSHYELYLDAMIDIGVKVENIEKNIMLLSSSDSIENSIEKLDIHPKIKEFLKFTFSIIDEGKPHKIAAIFTFGRENLIPNMFNEILHEFQNNFTEKDISKLIYYFERHIELDEDEHGPMALQMVNELAENDPLKWEEIRDISIVALEKRIGLWDAIYDNVMKKNNSWSETRENMQTDINEETYSSEFSNYKFKI
ncbi:MAG: DUF3050 domain-containing protein [Bacteroidota bacterium]|nr:DUF3050 domain-containing protein [Bacteroidota bacterium]|tara:strand:- start:1249 stop:2112 length:864 start_codon:yes stop_codon:yes gene_type:complete